MKTLILAPSKYDIYNVAKNHLLKVNHEHVEWYHYDLADPDADIEDLIHRCITISMFDTPRALVILFSPNHKSASEIGLAIAHLDEAHYCFIGVEGKRYAQNDPIIAAILKQKHIIEIENLTVKTKREFIINTAKKVKLKLSHGQLEYLNEVLPFDRYHIESEINKCSLYPKELTQSVLKLLIRPQMSDSVFELSKAIMNKELNVAYALYQDLVLLKVDPIAIIPILGWQLRLILQIFELQAQGVTLATMNTMLNENPYAFNKALEYTRYTSRQRVQTLLLMLSQLDSNIKQGKQDKKIGFERFLLESVR